LNQEKIGRFLSELRKEQGMTQQQLADTIGVSNKTISKWECGKGMPEDGYSKKAEENMMNLIQETEISKRKSRNSWSIILVTVLTVLLVGGLTIISSGGISMGVRLIDMPSLLPMLLVTILFLLGTNLWCPFGQLCRTYCNDAGKLKCAAYDRESLGVNTDSTTWHFLWFIGVPVIVNHSDEVRIYQLS